jgi:hypothetical protein
VCCAVGDARIFGCGEGNTLETKIVNNIPLDTDIATILARLDRSNPDALLKSIAAELLRLNNVCLGLVARMHAFEITQTISDQIASSVEGKTFAALPPAVVIEAAFSLSAEAGFHHLEYDSRGVPFRWTGPEPVFFVEVLVDRTAPATMRMRYSQIYSLEGGYAVQCFVDGEEIETSLMEVDGEYEVHGLLPARELVGGTVVSFVSPSVATPSLITQSQDGRQVGLAFRWLRIDPAPSISLDDEKAGEMLDEVLKEPEKVFATKPRRRVSSIGKKT